MNPYDFVRIDWDRPPSREKPIWHHRLVGRGAQQLFSGHLDVDIYAEKPIFIPAFADPNRPVDPRLAEQFVRNEQGQYIIPGSSLKGMLRTVVEALGSGCLTLYSGRYESDRVDYSKKILDDFRRCDDNAHLCLACRIFGMMKERGSGSGQMFLGKVNIVDAVVDPEKKYPFNKPIYTMPLMEPKPHHASFYLDESEEHIAGRKFYFHHSKDAELLTTNKIIMMGGKRANRFIQPLDYGTEFHFRIDFVNLTADEFGVLLLAIVLKDEDTRHKLGYAKPLGLGTVLLTPTSLTLINYAERYRQSGLHGGKKVLTGDDMWNEIYEHVNHFSDTQLVPLAMGDLQRIWLWPPAPGIEYYYPSKYGWFDTEDSIGKRVSDTRNVPRQA